MSNPARLLLALLVALAAMPLLALAAGPELLLEVDPDRVGLEDTFVATVRLTGSASGTSEPRLDLGPNFRILGTSKAHSISFVNGQTAVEVRFQFTVQPLREGIFDIGPAAVTFEGRELTSPTTRLQVVPGSVGGRREREPVDPWSRIFGEPRRRVREETRAEVKMVASLDKEQVYAGEAVTYTLRLLTQQNVKAVEPRSEPQLTGFWAEPVTVPDPPQPQKTTHEGEPYTSFLLKKTMLYPTSGGTLRIEPSVWGITLVVSDFFFGETTQITRATEPLDLKVLPLPEAGKPEGFAGAVGELSLAATLDRTEAAVNDALTLKVTLSGSGNFKSLPAPELPPLADFKLYNASATPAPAAKKNAPASSRTWEFVLVAKAPGDQVIAPIRYPYFDPARREYRVLETAPIRVAVEKGTAVEVEPAASGTAPIASGSQRAVEPVRRDIAYLKLEARGLGVNPRPLYQRRWLLALALAPLGLNLLAVLLVWGRRQRIGDAPLLRRRSAHKEARRRLALARRAAAEGKGDEVAARLSDAVKGYLGDRFEEPPQGLTRERIGELLGRRVSAEQRAALEALLDRLDLLRFTPAGADPKELDKLARETEARLVTLDRALGKVRGKVAATQVRT